MAAALYVVAISEAVAATAVTEVQNFSNKAPMETTLMEVPLMEGGGAVVELATDVATVGVTVVYSGQPCTWGQP